MRAMFSYKPVLFVALLFLAVSPSWATLPVTGGSHYGNFTIGSTYFDQCLAGTTSDACESLIATGNSLTVNGQNDPLYLFVEGTGLQFGGIPGKSMEFNVIDLGAVAAGTTFTIPGSLFSPAATSVFSCNYSQQSDILTALSSLVDSSGTNGIPGPCTPDLGSTSLTQSGGTTFLNTLSTDGTSFTTEAAFTDLVLAAPVVATAPEPASLGLLSLGLLALCGLTSILKTRAA